MKEKLLTEYLAHKLSRPKTDAFVAAAGPDENILNQLWSTIEANEEPFQRRAAYAWEHMLLQHPHLAAPLIPAVCRHFCRAGMHSGIYRHIGKILSRNQIPEEEQGLLYERCINLMLDPQTDIAVVVYAMDIAGNIATEHPDLIPEVRQVLEERSDWDSAGCRVRSERVLKRLSKVNHR